MRSYWTRILLGALAIFAIGMIGVTLVRRGVARVSDVVTGTGPLSIPLPFIPFQLDGNRLGTLERVVFNREVPRKVSSVQLEVKLDDSLVARGLEGCRLAANLDRDQKSRPGIHTRTGGFEHGAFFCATSDSLAATMVEFGHAVFHPGDVTVPLLVPQGLADDLRNGAFTDGQSDSAATAEAQADSIVDASERMADSLDAGTPNRGFIDSLKSEGLRRADSARGAVKRMADSVRRR